MNDNSNEINDVIKKIGSWMDLQRKITKWTFYIIIPLMIFCIGIPVYFETKLKNAKSHHDDIKDWYDVNNATRKGELEKALQTANELLTRTPLDFEGHYKKGEILLMMGNRKGAKESFQMAFNIFPMPKYETAIHALSRSMAEPDAAAQPPVGSLK